MSAAALIRSMLGLREERRSGVLNVDSDGSRTFIYLRDGVPIFAEEGTHGETLGRLLVRQRLLTQEQYAQIIQKMTEALVLNEQLRFGELAVELGHLSEQQVRKALVDQVRWKIVRAFQRTEVRWTFEDSDSALEDVGRFPMRIEALVLDAVRWVDDEQKAEMGLAAARDHQLKIDLIDIPALAVRFALTKVEEQFLFELDGRTVGETLESREAAEVDAPAIVTALLVTRAVSTTAEPRLARPATPMFEIPITPVQVSRPPPAPAAAPTPVAEPSAAPAAAAPAPAAAAPVAAPVPAAAAAPAAAPAPAAPHARPLLTRASTILQALEARRVKVEPERKPANEHEAKLLAERALQEGLPHLLAGRYAQAAPLLARASNLLPQSDEYKVYSRWCAVRMKGAPVLHSVETGELKKLALAATKADPNFGFGYYVAGACALDSGDPRAAVRLLTRALRLEPELLDANRLVRVAERALGDDKPKGLFSRDLFGSDKKK